MNNRKIDTFDVVNVLLMIGLVFITIYPFIYIINVSLSSNIYVYRNEVFFWPKGFTLDHYKNVILDSRVHIGFRNTVVYTVVGTFISLFLTSTGAYALSQKRMIMRRFFTLAIVFTILFSGGMIPMYLVAKYIGILDTMWAMILPGAISAFYLIIFRTFFQAIPEEILEAGTLDGLNDLGLFSRIIVPLSKPVFAAIGLFVSVGIWNNYINAAIYIRDEDLYPLTAMLRQLIIEGTIAEELRAGAEPGGAPTVPQTIQFATLMVTIFPIMMVYPFLQKHFVKGVLVGSVKQ